MLLNFVQMDYQVNFLKEKSMLHGIIEGVLNVELAKSYLAEIGELVRTNNVQKVLTDARDSIISMDEEKLIELSKSLNDWGFGSDLKRAVLIRQDVRVFKQWENLNFIEGMPRLRLFIEEDLAMEWLNQD